MSCTVSVVFTLPVFAEDWSKFCKTKGLKFNPAIAGYCYYSAAFGLEIKLNEGGHKNLELDIVEPPKAFTEIEISCREEHCKEAARLIQSISRELQHFNPVLGTYDTEFNYIYQPEGITVTGEKVLGVEDSALTKMNNRQLLLKTQTMITQCISEHVEGDMSQKTLQSIKRAIASNINDLETDNVLNGPARVGVESVVISWSDLYRSRWAICKAWFAVKVLRRHTRLNRAPTWFELFLGYIHETSVEMCEGFYIDDSDILAGELTIEWLSDFVENIVTENTNVDHTAALYMPSIRLDADIAFTPVAAVQQIKFNVCVVKDNVNSDITLVEPTKL